MDMGCVGVKDGKIWTGHSTESKTTLWVVWKEPVIAVYMKLDNLIVAFHSNLLIPCTIRACTQSLLECGIRVPYDNITRISEVPDAHISLADTWQLYILFFMTSVKVAIRFSRGLQDTPALPGQNNPNTHRTNVGQPPYRRLRLNKV